MKKVMMWAFALAMAVLTTAGCDNPTVLENNSSVPGDRALDGDPCNRELSFGHECVRRGEICPDGGNRPAIMQCVFNRWRCVVDTTRTCQRTEPPMCREGDENGTCNLGTCLGGTPVPARQTCLGGRFRCLPIEPGCPAATTDAGATPDSDVTPSVRPGLAIRYDGPVSGPVYAGAQDARLHRVTLNAERDLEIQELRFRLTVSSPTGQLSDAAGVTIFRDLKLVDESTGHVLMGPIEIVAAPNARNLEVRFATGPFTVIAHREMHLAVTADITYRFDPSITDTHFHVVGDGGDGRFFAAGAVRNLSDGSALSPEEIINNVVIEGNEFIIRRPNLTVELFNDRLMPRNTVKRAVEVPSLTLRLTASPVSDIRITRLRLGGGGRINIRDPFSGRLLQNVVLACSVWDGTTRITENQHPDSLGFMEFNGLNLNLTRGTTRFYRVNCNMDSVVEGDFGDAYVIGIGHSTDISAEDSIGTDPDVTIDPVLAQQLIRPTIIISVAFSGGALITPEPGMTYKPASIRYGLWYTGQTVQTDSTVEGTLISRLRVRLIGNSRCVESVNVASPRDIERPLAGHTVFPISTTTTAADIELLTPMINPISGSTFVITVQWARPVDPSIDPSGCHPGDVVQLGLDRGATAGEWSAYYSGGYNVRIIGGVSGELIYTSAPSSPIMNTFRMPGPTP